MVLLRGGFKTPECNAQVARDFQKERRMTDEANQPYHEAREALVEHLFCVLGLSASELICCIKVIETLTQRMEPLDDNHS